MLTLLLKLAAVPAAAVALVLGLLILLQDQLIFPRWAMGPSPALPAGAERLTLELPGGDRLAGVRLPPREGSDAGPLILGFGGNGWDADALALFLRALHPDHGVAAFHYRGYGPSTGRPGAAAILADALAVHDRLAPEAPEGIVAVGISLGAGPAAHLARHRPLRGAILVTPFDSLEALARFHYPWAPVRTFLRHRMEVAADLALADAPAAVITAAGDRVVPAARSAPVRAAARNLVFAAEITRADHNDLFDRPEFAAAMRAALAAIEDRTAR